MKRADRVHNRFNEMSGCNEVTFVDSICQTFLTENSVSVIELHTFKLNKLQMSIYQCQNKVLSLAGVGSDYNKVGNIVQAIKKLVMWLEEVLIAALIGIDEVNSIRQARKFLYQTV